MEIKSEDKKAVEAEGKTAAKAEAKRASEVTLEQIWENRKTPQLNKLLDESYYGPLTIRELVAIALADKVNFPKGLDTLLSAGDTEGNNTHLKFSITLGGEKSDRLRLTYEMFEGENF